jgi:hypothetical protein
MRRFLLLAPLAVAANPLLAQSAKIKNPAETITEADVARHIRVIADDSMMGRNTPSPGLEMTAQYIADQFKKFGLTPGGDNGSWLQRYPIPGGKLDFAQSRIVFAAGGKEAAAGFTTAARLAARYVPDQQATSAGVVLVSGRHGAVPQADVRGKLVLYVQPAGQDTAGQMKFVNQLLRASKGLLILSNLDSASHAKRMEAAMKQPTVQTAPAWAAYVRPEAVTGLADVLTAGDLDLTRVRSDTTPQVRELPGLTARFEAKTASQTAPNTVGILEGSDPKLKNEYIVFSAHMDHVGVRPGRDGTDSIHNGADDDASGTVGLIELAEAFSQPGGRPKRSILFVTVSGEEKGLWGSGYFADHPPVPAEQMVANVNLDMIGRNWKDTIVAIGKEHSDLGATLNRVVAAHPELKMTAIDDIWPQERFYFRSDHYNFARKGVPILFFFSGVHADYHQVTDSPDKIDAEKEARILRLVYYLGQEIGNAAERPKWNPESYKQIVKPQP